MDNEGDSPIKLLWQRSDLAERDWLSDLFSPIIDEQIFDGQHQVVLDDCILIDSYLHAQPQEYYAQFRGRNAWLLHLSDETYEGGYENYGNFRGVFRNYWSGVFNPRRVLQLPLGYTADLPRDPVLLTADQRPYLWSFAGAAETGSRPDMLRALLPIEPNFTRIRDVRKPSQALGREAYSRLLSNSVFVPCAMGNVNLDTFRVCESLEYGSIPILERRLTLDYFAQLFGDHPIPTFSTWNEAASFIAKLRIDHVGLQHLQSACMEWWTLFKAQLRSRIREFVSATRAASNERFVNVRPSIPAWQVIELLRHHSMGAARRRITVQVKRYAAGQKLRKTEGR